MRRRFRKAANALFCAPVAVIAVVLLSADSRQWTAQAGLGLLLLCFCWLVLDLARSIVIH